jgi:hypothetical protein
MSRGRINTVREGLFRVFIDGVEQEDGRAEEKEAVEACTNALLENPDALTYFVPPAVRVEWKDRPGDAEPPPEEEPADPPPEEEPEDPPPDEEPEDPPPEEEPEDPPTGALFSDGFESGDHSHTENGYAWTETSGKPDHRDAMSDGAEPYEGDYASRFRQDSTERNRLIRLAGPALKEFWFEHRNRIPSNYLHECGSGSTNNKWMEAFPTGARDKLIAVSQMWSNDEGGSAQSFEANAVEAMRPILHGDAISLADRGKYLWFGYHVKIEDIDSALARVTCELYREDGLRGQSVRELTVDPAVREFSEFQVMGWNNCGFSGGTMTWYVDAVRLHGTRPSWAA